MNLEMHFILYQVLTIAIGILLFTAGIIDIKRRQIGRCLMLVLLLACCAVIPVKKDFDVMDTAGGLAIGLCAIGMSIATREQIGKGDGIVISAVGLALGMRKCLFVVCTASLMMCATAILVLILRKGGKQTRLPFLPAVFAGYLLCIIL